MIRHAGADDLDIIRSIAFKTWPVTFREILSEIQIKYMLDMMYSYESLKEQIDVKQHKYLLTYLEDNNNRNIPDPTTNSSDYNHIYTGYSSYELFYNNSDKTKIHKIYILPEYQGYGFGRTLINEVKKIAGISNNSSLILNVNRNNKAVEFYKMLGFRIVAEENIDIGNGFLMEDYKMEMVINEKKSNP